MNHPTPPIVCSRSGFGSSADYRRFRTTLESIGFIRNPVFFSKTYAKRGIFYLARIYLRAAPVGRLEILPGNNPPAITKGPFGDAPDRLLANLEDVHSS